MNDRIKRPACIRQNNFSPKNTEKKKCLKSTNIECHECMYFIHAKRTNLPFRLVQKLFFNKKCKKDNIKLLLPCLKEFLKLMKIEPNIPFKVNCF